MTREEIVAKKIKELDKDNLVKDISVFCKDSKISIDFDEIIGFDWDLDKNTFDIIEADFPKLNYNNFYEIKYFFNKNLYDIKRIAKEILLFK